MRWSTGSGFSPEAEASNTEAAGVSPLAVEKLGDEAEQFVFVPRLEKHRADVQHTLALSVPRQHLLQTHTHTLSATVKLTQTFQI